MKTKLKHIFFLAAISFAATACGGSMAKPVSGLDVSMLSPSLLTISPKADDGEESEQPSDQQETDSENKPSEGPTDNYQQTIINLE